MTGERVNCPHCAKKDAVIRSLKRKLEKLGRKHRDRRITDARATTIRREL